MQLHVSMIDYGDTVSKRQKGIFEALYKERLVCGLSQITDQLIQVQ